MLNAFSLALATITIAGIIVLIIKVRGISVGLVADREKLAILAERARILKEAASILPRELMPVVVPVILGNGKGAI